MRDYEKYIARQFKRGTSRQELNVSWLKKNELELKRHINELRDNIRQNWTMTGLELSKDLRQFWQNSRPTSPARLPGPAGGAGSGAAGAGTTHEPKSPTQRSGLLDIPRGEHPAGNDFAAGYILGLIGGVRSWVCDFSPSSDPLPSVSHEPLDITNAPISAHIRIDPIHPLPF